MASVSSRLISSGLRAIRCINTKSPVIGSLLKAQKLSSVVTCRGFSSVFSSYSHIHNKHAINSVSVLSQSKLFSKQLHTAGDKDLVEFLKDEIKMEKEGAIAGGKLPKLKGFDLTSSDGPNVTLTKKSENETIVIKLNVNHSVDEPLSSDEASQQEEKPPQMVSKPAFVVEISKGSGKTLAIQCVFPPEDDVDESQQSGASGEQYEDVIEIQDVAMLEQGQEWTDDVYTLSGSLMDGNLYDMLLKLLEERGVDGEVIQQLIDFSTSYEHNRYVSLLEQLQQFAGSK